MSVAHEVDKSEIKVMFLKPCNDEKTLFLVNEKDVSFVSETHITAILPQPVLVVKGDRLFYRFKHPINVFFKFIISWQLSFYFDVVIHISN